MKTTSMRNERRMAGWLVLWCMGLLAMAVFSCDSELDVQQQYPFTVETMPVPKQLAKSETAEIRCEVKSEGDFDGTVYTIRYFQYDGTGSLKLENGTVFKPNDRYLLEDAKFRLYYTSQCDEAQNLVVVVENNWGDWVEMEFDFNHADGESEDDTESPQPDKEGGA